MAKPIPFDNPDDIVVSTVRKPCLVCDDMTYYVEKWSEGHFCCQACMDVFYRELEEESE